MHILNIDNLLINHAGREIFRDLSWAISDRERTGLVGPNGAGKSSLLKAIAGVYQPDGGTINPLRGVRVGYLPQEVELRSQPSPPHTLSLRVRENQSQIEGTSESPIESELESGNTLWDIASAPPPELAAVEHELVLIEAALSDPAVYGDEGKLTRTLARQEKAVAEYERLGGPRHEARVKELLMRLGFAAGDYDLPTESLSGGEKKLAVLVRLALEQPEVLLLDEPDNHLDLEAKRHLEGFIRAYEGAVVIVSHDRYLLDEVVTQIAELENGALTLFPGNYSRYATEVELRRLRQQQMYTAQQKRIQQIEANIKEWQEKAKADLNERFARQARSRQKMLDRMEERGEIIERVQERKRMDLQMNGWRGSNRALELAGLTMGFGDDLLFLDLNLQVWHGERVGLIGPNGAGKSVLFKLILDEMQPLEGQIKIGPSSRIGYYSQEHQTLAEWLHRSPLELVRDVKPMHEGDAVAFLLKFLFKYDQLRLPISGFSGGERSRLQLACLMLQNPNLLLLDEPTNNLDIYAVEVLESALEDFEGAILTISHDRYFLDRVVDRVVELEDGGLTGYPGGYTEYLNHKDKKKTKAKN